MADIAKIAAGTLLKMSDGNVTPTFAAIAEVETIGAISESRAEVEATPLTATAKRYIGGIKDGQTIEISMFLLTDDATQNGSTGIYSVFKSNLAREFVIAPKGTAKQFRFSAILTKHDMGPFTGGDPMKRVVTMRIASDVTEEANTNT